ncbi:TOG array regulator of axonemal microtubules protein 2-like isoform X2 [Cylas formicarius]|uniref:TOG array regulator of axonemal microtubules protein 2-like isoform X2 n=1 Tax=Cylas formicarius TaxID=197179 RepID=UPI002958D47F|nr:TOG array regulator of axonemal microtubules protein 2-like isoform X2 [Cylas formicarius]
MYSSSVGHTVCAKSNCYHFFAKQILVMQRTKSNVSRSNALQRSLSYKIHPSARSNVFESSSLACPNPSKNTSIATALENSCTISGIEQDLSQAIAKLKENDWNIALRGLAEIVEICRVTDSDFVYPHMTSINQRIIDLLKSPRSHVCRTTCQATGHLFEYVKDTRRPEFDEIVDTLLCRTADSNKFIRRDANLALDCMVTHISTLHAVRAICAKGPEHKNFLVRSAAARLIVCAAVIAGPHAILNPNYSDYTRRRIILNMVKFLNDKTYETRKFGQRLYRLLSIDKMFDFYLKRYLERDAVQKIKLCVKMDNVKKL